MRFFAQLALLAVAATSGAIGQMLTPEQIAANKASLQTVRQMENDWAAALVKPDLAVIDRIEAPEYTFIGADGATSDKDQGQDDLKSGVLKFESFRLDELEIQVYGDSALALGLDVEKSSYKGADTSGQYRFSDMFVRRNGVWQCVATHVSKVAKP